MSDVNNVNKAVIGLLHPGEMGAAVGRCLTGRGHEVLWASQGRGPDTAARAAAAGLADAGTVAALAARAELIISVCPPHAALDVAWAVHGFGGLYVDANAVAPGTAREVARLICESGGRYVDGGIIGPPPEIPGRTQLYLSGTDAEQVAALFEGTPLDTVIVGGSATAASAVKMAYAAWTKGTAALLLSVRALAREQGVEDALLAQWAISQPGLEARSAGRGPVGGGQGLALGRRDGGDRRDDVRGRAPRRVPPGRRGDLPAVPARRRRRGPARPGPGRADRGQLRAVGRPVVTDPGHRRRPGRRALLLAGAIIAAVLIAAAASVAIGRSGPGPGPLSVGYVSSAGLVAPDAPAMIVIPVGAPPSTAAVIDAVIIRGGNGYRAPRQLRVVGVPGRACAGLWHPVTGPGSFTARCAPGGTVALLHRLIPRHPAAAAIDIGIEVGPPGPGGCWGIGRVAVRYHVGPRRYTAGTAESLSGCTSQ